MSLGSSGCVIRPGRYMLRLSRPRAPGCRSLKQSCSPARYIRAKRASGALRRTEARQQHRLQTHTPRKLHPAVGLSEPGCGWCREFCHSVRAARGRFRDRARGRKMHSHCLPRQRAAAILPSVAPAVLALRPTLFGRVLVRG